MPPLVPTLLVSLAACAAAPPPPEAPPGGAAHPVPPHPFHGAEAWSATFDDPRRDAWQRPDLVLAAMELERHHDVADVGAGTGYFSVRLARAVPEGTVRATDIEPDMVRFLEARASREGLPHLTAHLATGEDAGLPVAGVDRILVVHVWHHLDDRARLAGQLAAALRVGGRLVVVDYAPDAEQGPRPAMRRAPEAVVADLRAAGLDASVHPTRLPGQYVVVAERTGVPR